MNIVQLQYKLRDMPLSAIQAAANGRFPDIPEMLATMELNRRERMEKAAAQPPTKSIKEQLEEKLTSPPQEQMGLPAMLQQAQQAGGPPQQDQVQQQMPQGAPQGMPQGVPQRMAQGAPQGMPQQPQQMREGGVAGLPTHNMFKRFDEGGIVAFAGGDLVPNDDQSAAEIARLKRAEEAATARDLQAARESAPAPYMPPEALEGIQVLKQAPFVQELTKAVNDMDSNIEVTTPQQEMEKRQALYKQYGIRPPGEDELARIAASKAAYEQDRQERAQYQGMKSLAEAARPNIHGRYLPGTIAGSTASFGLSNLEVDRTFRDANDKAEVAAKESKRLFELGDLNSAIQKSDESKQFRREANKAKVTAFGQAASSGIPALGTYMSNAEQKRYHDMYKDLTEKDLKIKAAKLAQDAQLTIPELFRNIDIFEKRYPDIAKTLSPEQKLELGAEMVSVNKGLPTKAQTAYAAQVIKVDNQRAAERQKLNGPLEQTLLLLQSTGKDPDKVEKIRKTIDDNNKRIEERHKYPDPPKAGLASLNPTAPALSENPGAEKTRVRVDKNGKVIEPPNP